MRVLITTDTIGGVWTFTRELTTQLLERGCEVALVSFGRKPSPTQQDWCDKIGRGNPSAFRYVSSSIPLEWMQNNEQTYIAGAALLRKVAREFSCELMLSSQFCFGAVPLSCPKIIVAHSDVFSWAEACGKSPLPSSSWLERYHAFVTNGLNGASAVVAPTHWMLSALSKSFRVPPLSYVISNGRSIRTKQAARKNQAVTAGRLWDEAKNLQILKQVASRIPIVVAGEADADSEALPPDIANMTFIGPQSESALLALLRESAIYLCTSKYEPFGLAPLEAALCGCAVIANDIPSLREVWADAALYFKDASSLSALLRQLKADPVKLRLAQQRSCRRARAFTSERMADGYYDLFDLLMSDTRSDAHAA